MRALFVCFYVLSAVSPLMADSIISANWSKCGESGSAYLVNSAYSDAHYGPCGSFSANAWATAGPGAGVVQVEAFLNGISLELNVDAFSATSVDVPEPGLYSLSFALWGLVETDTGAGAGFSVNGEGLNSQWGVPGGHFWQSGPNQTFTTVPVMLEEGPYPYTTDVHAGVSGNLGVAIMTFSAHFIGLQPVAAVPEPGSFILLGSTLAVLMLLRQRHRARRGNLKLRRRLI